MKKEKSKCQHQDPIASGTTSNSPSSTMKSTKPENNSNESNPEQKPIPTDSSTTSTSATSAPTTLNAESKPLNKVIPLSYLECKDEEYKKICASVVYALSMISPNKLLTWSVSHCGDYVFKVEYRGESKVRDLIIYGGEISYFNATKMELSLDAEDNINRAIPFIAETMLYSRKAASDNNHKEKSAWLVDELLDYLDGRESISSTTIVGNSVYLVTTKWEIVEDGGTQKKKSVFHVSIENISYPKVKISCDFPGVREDKTRKEIKKLVKMALADHEGVSELEEFLMKNRALTSKYANLFYTTEELEAMSVQELLTLEDDLLDRKKELGKIIRNINRSSRNKNTAPFKREQDEISSLCQKVLYIWKDKKDKLLKVDPPKEETIFSETQRCEKDDDPN